MMDLVKRWNLQNTAIELDAKAIVDAVHSQRKPIRNWGQITTKCMQWLKESQQISVVCTRGNGNKAAHELAKWADKEPNKE
jgi:hypothetical protein